MTTSVPHPLSALAAELAALGRRIDAIGAELHAVAATPASGGWASSAQARPGDVLAWAGVAPAPGPPPTGPVGAAPGHRPPPRVGPVPLPPPGAGHPPVGARPARAARPSAGRLIAWAGGAVTVLGVVMLLALAASRGWFSPAARVGAGAALGLALVAVAARLRRRDDTRGAAVALAGTGFATLHLVVVGATAVLGLAAPPAVALALAVGAAGLALADRWRAQALGTGVVVAGVLLAPVLADGALLLGLVLALHAVAVPAIARRGWALLAAALGAGTAAHGVALALSGVGADGWAVVVLVAALAVATAVALFGTRILPAPLVAALVAAAPLPVLAAAPGLPGGRGVALALLAAAVPALAAVHRPLRVAGLVTAAAGVFQATVLLFDGSSLTAVLLGQAVALGLAAGAVRSRAGLAVAGGFALVGAVRAVVDVVPPGALARFPQAPFVVAGAARPGALAVAAAVSVLLGAAAVAGLWAGGRCRLLAADAPSAPAWVSLGLIGLYGATGAVVTTALLIAPDRLGFTAGHAAVTVSWTVGALVLAAHGVRRPALRVAAVALVAAAVAKLVSFDLVALDGFVRVAAFLGAGLVLLAAGTRYARMLARADAAAETAGPAPAAS